VPEDSAQLPHSALKDDQGAGLFASTTAKLIEKAKLNTRRQRQDSTHILSTIKVLTRLGLFVDTITQFLERLRKEHPGLLTRVPAAIREKYLDREGYFADARSSEAPRRLDDAALDLYWIVRLYKDHAVVSKMASYGLLERLFREQCVAPEAADPERIVFQEKPSSSSLQSSSDPDVTYGHKGKGYAVQLAETCAKENPFEVVTAVSVNGANESDQHQVLPILAQTERTCGDAADDMHTDCGYGSGDNIVRAKDEHGTNLLAPIGSQASAQSITAGDFEFDAAGERVLKCPTGEMPVEHQPSRTGRRMLAVFTEKQCQACQLRGQCPTEPRGDKRVLSFTPADVAVAKRRVEQETPEFKERHKIRSGIEATNSELKRCHGLGKLRVRRRPRVALSVRLKVLALNVKRYVTHLTDSAAATAVPAPICAC